MLTRFGKHAIWLRALLCITAFALCGAVGAQTFSQLLSFQGRLCAPDGKPVPDGVYGAEFRIHDAATGGILLWSEVQAVTQTGGVFSVLLGSSTAFPDKVFTAGDRWLAIKIGSDPEMPTRTQLTPSPWAIRAATADSATDANRVDGFHAKSTPTPNYILPLDATGKFPSSVIPPHADWRLAGNAGTSPATDFLGTTDNQALVFRTNNIEVARIDAAGHLGIGTKSPGYPLDVDSPSDVYGEAAIHGVVSSTGAGAQHWGVYGETHSTCESDAGGGVLGAAFAGRSSGVFGDTSSTSGTGVFGRASASSGTTYGVRGTCSSADGYAGYFFGRGYFSGNVGIGTTSPLSGLTVVDNDTGNPALSVTHTLANDSQPAIRGVHNVTDGKGTGVWGVGGDVGVRGEVTGTGGQIYTGVYGYARGGGVAEAVNHAVHGWATGGSGTNIGVRGSAIGGRDAYGVYGYATGGTRCNLAGMFEGDTEVYGDLMVTGNLYKGSGSFKIDHPLDPENKYLSHSFVESPDMMNIYNGNVTLNANGEGWVELPEWFEALNRDFRYQLTCIGEFAPVYVAERIHNNRFKIAGGSSGIEVSWQVTGIRQDPYANAHRIQVEEEKRADERGLYLHPDAYGQREEKGIGHRNRPGPPAR